MKTIIFVTMDFSHKLNKSYFEVTNIIEEYNHKSIVATNIYTTCTRFLNFDYIDNKYISNNAIENVVALWNNGNYISIKDLLNNDGTYNTCGKEIRQAHSIEKLILTGTISSTGGLF